MAKNLYLHIGLHKTGSTSLQCFLQKNRNLLLKQGYLYPQSGFVLYAHHNLSWQIINDNRFNQAQGIWNDFHGEVESEDVHNIILSSEDFELFNRDLIAQLHSEIQSYQTKIIVYLKRQDKLILSLYSHRVKTGKYRGSFQDFVSREMRKTNRYNFDRFLHPWQEKFGKENIIVRPLEASQIKERDIGLDFLNTVKFSLDKNLELLGSAPGLNAAPSPKILEVMRKASEILVDKIGVAPDQINHKYLQPILKYSQKSSQTREKLNLFSAEETLEILKEFEESNQIVARDYLGRKNGTLFCEAVLNEETNQFDINELSSEELLEIFLVLIEPIWAKLERLEK